MTIFPYYTYDVIDDDIIKTTIRGTTKLFLFSVYYMIQEFKDVL